MSRVLSRLVTRCNYFSASCDKVITAKAVSVKCFAKPDLGDWKLGGSIQRFATMASQNGTKTQKTYHKKASGEALKTAEAHDAEHELKLFGGCFWYDVFNGTSIMQIMYVRLLT